MNKITKELDEEAQDATHQANSVQDMPPDVADVRFRIRKKSK